MSASQKVVVVTGASQGIGAEIVKAFRQLDYRVVATSRTITPSDDPNVLTIAGDIGDPATAQRVIAETVARFGRIDTLVNNAGIYIGKPFTKGGLNAATRALAIEYAKQGIRVNAVAPGVTKTPMHAEEYHELLGSFHPLGRMGEASEVASAVVFLDSAEFITGEILHVDGGQSAGR